MATCISCRSDPCRCTPAALELRLELDEEQLARLVQLRQEAVALSPAYLAWTDGGRVGPEPLVSADVRRRFRELAEESQRLGS